MCTDKRILRPEIRTDRSDFYLPRRQRRIMMFTQILFSLHIMATHGCDTPTALLIISILNGLLCIDLTIFIYLLVYKRQAADTNNG